MPLNQQLVNTRRHFLAKLSEDKAAVIGVAEALLRSSNVASGVPRRQEKVPGFALQGPAGEVALAPLLRRGPVIVTFIQGGWSPFCRLELAAWQHMLPYAQALSVPILALTPQSVEENARTRDKLGLGFDLLRDPGCAVARSWRLAYALPLTVRSIYRQMKVDLERINGERSWTLPLPATYVVDRNGRIAACHAEPDVSRRMEPLDALMTAAALLDPVDGNDPADVAA